MRLWFKAEYVEPIIRERKTSTIRKSDGTLPQPGETIACCVGPRLPFAHVKVTAVEHVRIRDLTEEHARREGIADVKTLRARIRAFYPGTDRVAVILFELVDYIHPSRLF